MDGCIKKERSCDGNTEDLRGRGEPKQNAIKIKKYEQG
jgi:hypothetical protein